MSFYLLVVAYTDSESLTAHFHLEFLVDSPTIYLLSPFYFQPLQTHIFLAGQNKIKNKKLILTLQHKDKVEKTHFW